MDVPAATPAPPTPPPVAVQPAPAQTTVAVGTLGPAPAPPSAPVGPIPTHSTVGAQSAAASNQPTDTTLSPVVAKLFNAAEQNVQVSFQIQANEVVTVFTDKSTGKEIVQFPSQALIALAEMYDKNAGKVLDKSV
jgi:uncharacterized FlaG/YvyC family protein